MFGNGVDVFATEKKPYFIPVKDNIADVAKALLKVTKLCCRDQWRNGCYKVYQEGVFNEDNDNNTVMIETPTIGVGNLDTNGGRDNSAAGFYTPYHKVMIWPRVADWRPPSRQGFSNTVPVCQSKATQAIGAKC